MRLICIVGLLILYLVLPAWAQDIDPQSDYMIPPASSWVEEQARIDASTSQDAYAHADNPCLPGHEYTGRGVCHYVAFPSPQLTALTAVEAAVKAAPPDALLQDHHVFSINGDGSEGGMCAEFAMTDGTRALMVVIVADPYDPKSILALQEGARHSPTRHYDPRLFALTIFSRDSDEAGANHMGIFCNWPDDRKKKFLAGKAR
jgi:hypothetical protein